MPLVAIAQQAAPSPQTKETFSQVPTEPETLNYLLYLPKGYAADADKEWPLVVFLHGAGERGDNLDQVKQHGPPKRVEAGEEFPFILVSPQCPKEGWWPSEPVHGLITHLEKTLKIDADRIYLTGLSMGGYGTWALASDQPDRFAAIVPICGGGTPYLMRRLSKVPVWAFHGGKDSVVPLEESQRLVDALKKAGNTQTRFTIYPEAGHDSWTEAYDNPELYEWLLAQKRGAPATGE
ncbi:MAG: prolyl oligopeptidase family serine peptidase [Verrucomicrobiae bacterium]|nr:prolyl oligopeptidase family serine peptidase [Verrucomicrobiae bacterium]